MRPAASTCASLGLGFGAVTDLRRLQYFVAVARERNFTRAAERLHIAQPALSRQVKQLEQELGVELLHRTTHEFQLTPAGRFLLERGPALLSAADELWRDVRGYGSGERGGVTVAYGASASYETAPRLLRVLTERHPGIAMTTAVKSVAEILSGLRDGSVDIGLVRCPPKGAGIDAQPVRMERQGVLLRRDHRLAANSTLTALDLAEETVLLHPREGNPGHYDAVLGLFREHALEPRVELRTLSFDLRLYADSAGWRDYDHRRVLDINRLAGRVVLGAAVSAGAARGGPADSATPAFAGRGQAAGGRNDRLEGSRLGLIVYSCMLKICPCQPFSSKRLERINPCSSYQRTIPGTGAGGA